ncbi:hypothetical protein ACHAQI_006685 [Fusarium lateritium]
MPPVRSELRECQERAIRGDEVPTLLDDSDCQAALVRGIRLHYDFAMSEPVERLSASMPLIARARNARRIMSNDIPEQQITTEKQPYCIWYPDIATEKTYRSLAERYPDMKYQVGRACAAAGYYALFKTLHLLPDVSIAEEARESETEGGKLIYEEVMGFKYRYAVMNDFKRSIDLIDATCPAYLNGDTEVRWRLTARKSVKYNRIPDVLPCIEEDKHVGLEDQDVDERHSILTEDEVKLLYTPLPQDLPTVKKTLLTQMAAYDGNIERYARLASGKTLTELDEDCIVRGILHHNMFARWWTDQIKNNTIYSKSTPNVWGFQRAILARRIMLNDLSVFEPEDSWPSGRWKPYIIWWPLKPNEHYLRVFAESVPEMKIPIAAAAIACDYVGLYKLLDPEPSWDLWVVADEFSRNPFFREDQERRAREKGVKIKDGSFENVAYSELTLTKELTVLDIDDEHKTIRDCVEKRQIHGRYEMIPSTSLVQIRTWEGAGPVSPVIRVSSGIRLTRQESSR